MTVFVVDANVAISANGRNTHAGMLCQLACIEKLEQVKKHGVVAVDDVGAIMGEYAGHLCFSGKSGAGDAFYKYVFDNQYRGIRVRRVAVTPSGDDRRGFEELPENSFDPSDRKFLAVAVVAKAVILNATDSDWVEQKELMESLEVEVDQLCPKHASKAV